MAKENNDVIHNDVIPRLEVVEQAQEEFKKSQNEMRLQLNEVKSGQSQLELTVMKDGKETRDLLHKFVDHTLGVKETKVETQEKISLKKLDTKEKVVVTVIGIFGLSGFWEFISKFF